MNSFWKKYGKIVFIVFVALAVCAVAAVGVYHQWYYSLPRFQDVTMELGESMPKIESFMTELAEPGKAKFVTDTNTLDLSKTGQLEITLRHGRRSETVLLTIQDTTAPQITLQDISRAIGYELAVEDFVVSSYDLSETTIDFAHPIAKQENYGNVTVEIIITDASGNSTTAAATVSYMWIVDSFTMELGDTLEKSDLLLDAQKDAHLLDQDQLDAVNQGGVGEYTVTSTDQGQIRTCKVTVVDTTAPVLELQDLQRDQGDDVPVMEDFVLSCTDLSGDVTLTFLTEPNTRTLGLQTIQVEAKDIYGNTTVAEATLNVVYDGTPPAFYGVDPMVVEKHSTPDYVTGVGAYDNRDGEVTFTYDASKVDTSKAGTYTVFYTAYDRSGNRATYRRAVNVKHDWEDTQALIAKTAAKCGNSVESIRDYLRGHIGYTSYWGGDDPVYNGLTERRGNCYVQAACLKALLTYRGYSCQTIWTTDKTHYWLLVDMGGYWRHVDSTPGSMHSRYSLMTDEQRYETLSGRDWDRDAWPAAE